MAKIWDQIVTSTKNAFAFVQGDNEFGRSTNKTVAKDGSPSGFGTIFDTANTPTSDAYHEIKVKQAPTSSSGLDWAWQLISAFSTGAIYETVWTQASGWLPYKRVHSNRWFPVKETMSPITGDSLVYNTTTLQWENKTLGLGNGLVTLTIAQVRALTTAPTTPIYITDNGGGTFIYDSTDTTSSDNTGTILVASGGYRLKRQDVGQGRTLNVQWFGAKGDEINDDTIAIQKAIDAGIQYTNGSDNLRSTIFFPTGRYKITSPLNVTNKTGMWLVGAGGRYISSVILGNTGGIIVDMSGSSLSGIENLMLSSPNGYTTPSTIGIQFALSKNSTSQATAGSQLAGLNCGIRNCCIFMGSFIGSNGGLGSVGIMNCRSEEMGISDCLIQANTSGVFTNTNNLAITGYNYTILSPYCYIQDDNNGSMGVVDFSGQCSFQNFERINPALLLNGVNGFRIHGYFGFVGATAGRTDTYSTAIRTVQYTNSVQISGTVESFSTLINTQNQFENGIINVSVANQFDHGQPVIVTGEGSVWKGCKVNVWWGNPAEVAERAFIYNALVSNGNVASTSGLNNCEFHIPQFPDNVIACSANLLKNSINCKFLTGQPFEKKGMFLSDLKDYPKTLGTMTAGTNQTVTGQIIRFTPADKFDTTGGNGGYYLFKVKGTVMIGGAGSGGNSVCQFESTVLVSQLGNSGRSNPDSNTLITTIVSPTPSYCNINSVEALVTFPGSGYPYVSLKVSTSGTASGETIKFHGQVQLLSDFAVNHSVILD